MRKVLLLLVGTAVLWIPAVSFAGDSPSGPSKLPNKTGTYGVKSDVRKSATCENQRSDSSSVETHRAEARPVDPSAALKGCSSTSASHKTERDHKDSADSGEDGSDSQAKSVESNGKSHGKSTESHGKGAESHGNPSNSAMTCKALEGTDSAHFQTAYGSRPNAFGKCVSAHAHGNHG